MEPLNLESLSVRGKPSSASTDGEKISYLYTKDTFFELLKSGKRVFGTPGAALSWGIGGHQNMATMIGESGEKDTAIVLDEWVNNNDAFCFHSVKPHITQGDIDHIIIKGNELLIIDSKKWKSSRKYSIGVKGNIIRGKTAFSEGYVKIGETRNKLQQQLPSMRVKAAISLAQSKVFVVRDRNWYKAPYRLIELEKLNDFLTETLTSTSEIDLNILQHFGQLCIKERRGRDDIIRNADSLL